MKIGIITYHNINNFGAQLQAAALQQFLESEGHDAEVVDYYPPRVFLRSVATIVRPLIKGFNLLKTIQNYKIRKSFAHSIYKMCKVSKKKVYTKSAVEKLAKKYDALIVGSDEIWNFDNYLGYMPMYMNDFKTSDNQIILSYAASIGALKTDNDDLNNLVKQKLAKFNKILVRDPSTFDWVESLGYNPTRVADPTILHDLVPANIAEKGEYFLLTGSLTTSQIKIAEQIASENNLKLLSAGYVYSGYENIAVLNITPLEWIAYVKNASMHLTSLFHGSIFSFKEKTPFAVIKNPEKSQKIDSLLDLFGLGDRCVVPNFTKEQFLNAVNSGYDDYIMEKIAAKREESQKILLDALTK